MTDPAKTPTPGIPLSPAEVEIAIRDALPEIDHHGDIVEDVGDGTIRMRLPFDGRFVGRERWQNREGAVFSGPMVMGFGDTAMYACVIAALGRSVIPVMVNYNMNFLRPAQASDLIAEARIVRAGGRLYYLECWLRSDGVDDPCAHVTSTYRVARIAD